MERKRERSMDVVRPAQLLQPLFVPRKTLTGPGPSNMSPRVEAAASLSALGTFQLHPEMITIINDVREALKYLFQTTNDVTLCISGCAHAAAEAVCDNLLETGSSVLIGCNGLWGERFAEMAARKDANVEKLVKAPGQVFELSEIEEKLKVVRPVLTFITFGESTGGTLQPMEGIGPLCHRYGSLLVVDGVAAVGAAPMFMDRWDIDVLYTGSQKALSSIPGITPISFSSAAWKRIVNRKTKVRTFLSDIRLLAVLWNCIPDANRGYHHTPASALFYTLREALAEMVEEGLEERWRRHSECTALLHKGIERLGLELLVKEPSHRLPVVSSIRVPSDVDWLAVSQYAMNRYKVEIAGSLGSSAGSTWRIGIMGHNARPETVSYVLRVLEESLKTVRNQAKTASL